MFGSISKSLTCQDALTAATEFVAPVVDLVRGSLIAKDGLFAMSLANGGGVVGYARFGWVLFDTKDFGKALKRAQSIHFTSLPGVGNGTVPGVLVHLHADDAAAFGVDLTKVGDMQGVICVTTAAYMTATSGKAIPFLDPASDRDTRPVSATPIEIYAEAVKQGSRIQVPARGQLPALNIPGFTAATVIDAGSQKAALVQSNPYADLIGAGAGVVAQQETINNRYAARSRRTSRR